MFTTKIEQDTNGNEFVRVDNIRTTRLENCSWESGATAIRIQAYRDELSNSLHMGAELPLKDLQHAFRFVSAISILMSNS